MSNFNRVIAESLGYTVKRHVSGYYLLYRPDGEKVFSRIDEKQAWLDIPDFEHDLNAAWPLFWLLPMANIANFKTTLGTANSVGWLGNEYWTYVDIADQTAQAFARAICEAYCQFKGIVIPAE